MAIKVKPVGNRLVVEPIKKGDTYEGTKIWRPEDQQVELNEGDVLRVSVDGTTETCPVKAGERVVYPSYAGTAITLPEGKFLVIEFKHVLAVLEVTPDA